MAARRKALLADDGIGLLDLWHVPVDRNGVVPGVLVAVAPASGVHAMARPETVRLRSAAFLGGMPGVFAAYFRKSFARANGHRRERGAPSH